MLIVYIAPAGPLLAAHSGEVGWWGLMVKAM